MIRLLTALSAAALLLTAPQLCHARTALDVPFVGQWDCDITALRVTPDKVFPGDAITVSVDIACRTCSGSAGDVAVIVQLHDSRGHVDEFTQHHRLGPAGSRDTITFTHQLTRPGQRHSRRAEYLRTAAIIQFRFSSASGHHVL